MTDPRRWQPQGFSKHIGFHDFREEPGGVISVEIDLGEQHLNAGGIAHGGVLLSMLDSVMGGAVLLTVDMANGEWTATESLTTNFMRPAKAGRLKARGWLERRGKLTAFVSGEVTNEKGEIVARATGVWAIRKG